MPAVAARVVLGDFHRHESPVALQPRQGGNQFGAVQTAAHRRTHARRVVGVERIQIDADAVTGRA